MKPPSGGPMMGPSSAGMVSHAIALTMSASVHGAQHTSRPTGTIIAPPMPCSTRGEDGEAGR